MGRPYVSNLLSHFVGNRHPSEDERNFERLRCILRGTDWKEGSDDLLSEGKRLRLGKWEGNGSMVLVTGSQIINPTGSLCDESLIRWRPICFCDIPKGSFRRHIRHYGAFGLAFKKSFLVLQGANPVFYVARNSVAKHVSPEPTALTREDLEKDGHKAIAEHMAAHDQPPKPLLRPEHLDNLVLRLRKALMAPAGTDEFQIESNRVFLDAACELFSFVKCFDDSLPMDNADNYYMEREWRVHGFVYFDLEDVARVYVRDSGRYEEEIREEFPDVYVHPLPLL